MAAIFYRASGFTRVARQGQANLLRMHYPLRFASRFSTYFTPMHEYLKVEGKQGIVGITDYAQKSLGDVVYVELPSVGTEFAKGDIFGAVESVKAASDTYAPVTGKVLAVNEDLVEDPHLVNEKAMDGGWFMKISIEDASELDDLLDEKAYAKLCEEEQDED